MASRSSALAALNVVALLVLCGLPATTEAHTQFGAYNKTCPQAEEIVFKEMAAILAKSPDLAGPVLRLFSVDCLLGGCEGSILLNSTANNTAEKDAPLNKGLRGYDVVDSIKAKLEVACPGVISCSDILALAARDSVRIVQRCENERGGMSGQGDQGDLGDPGETSRAVAAGAALRRRRRRLTLAPAAENRFSLLQATPEEHDADEIGEEDHVAFRVAEEAIEDYPSRPSSPVVRRPRKSDEELLAEFWADAGFPSPSSRFWERRSSPDSAAPGKTEGPYIPIPTGREDGNRSSAAVVAPNSPKPGTTITDLIALFARFNLTAKDLAILSGTHTIGKAHCSAFSPRLYNFNSSSNASSDPTLDANYTAMLRG
ncbi:hypothetical protein ACQ4PT_069401 [Festuca glaucescens]